MSEVVRLTKLLLSLPELTLRAQWLGERLSVWPLDVGVHRLDGLAEASACSEPDARYALLAVATFLAGLQDDALRQSLRAEAMVQGAFALGRMLRVEQRPSVFEHTVADNDSRIPDYGVGRELSVGERRSLARRPSRLLVEKLTLDPHPMVIGQLLKSPSITEDDVLRIAAQRPARQAAIRELAASAKWLARGRVRHALVLNPGVSADVAMPLLCVCNRAELREVIVSTALSAVRRAAALELLEKLPPLKPDTVATPLVQ